MDSPIIFEINDSKGRPLIISRDNGLSSLYRYADMLPGDRETVLRFFLALKDSQSLDECDKNKTIKDIEDYLDYKIDEDFCG